MRRLRHDIRIALLGLLALAAHFAVLIGHHHDHLAPLGPPAGSHVPVTVAAHLFDAARRDLAPTSPQNGEHDESDCEICQTLAAGTTLALPAPPALPAGFAYAGVTFVPSTDRGMRVHRVFAFDARGPPGALTS